MMDNIFQEEMAQGWLHIYMDDTIIATADDNEEHSARVHQFLDKLAQHDLYLKPEKCQFHQKEVKYLGVIIGGGQVQNGPSQSSRHRKLANTNDCKRGQEFPRVL